MSELVTLEQATEVFGRAPTAAQIKDLNTTLRLFDITTPQRIAHFMAQIAHESGGLRWMEEIHDGSNYEGVADLGNTQPGDGKRFKGVGPIQVTGRYNYQQFANHVNDPKVMQGVSYVRTAYPFTISGFWWHQNKMNAEVDKGASVDIISAIVNGIDPANGLAERRAYYRKAVAVFTGGAPKPKGGKVIFTLEALRDTYLKKAVTPAAEQPENQKKFVPAGAKYGVVGITEVPANAHSVVQLAFGAGTWYVFDPHWKKHQLATKTPTAAINWRNFSLRVTPNLTVGEVLQWDLARLPETEAEVREILRTAAEFQKIRDAWGSALSVTSFFRPEPINSAVGGVRGSQHTLGKAIDIYPANGRLDEFYEWLRVRWTGGLGDGRNRGFIHLDTRNNGRFVLAGGVTPFVTWLY